MSLSNTRYCCRRHWTHCVLIISCLVALASCETTSNIQPATDEIWRSKGKFVFRDDHRRQSGNFDWRQHNETYEIRLYGPLGMGTILIEGDNQYMSIRQGNKHYQSDDAQQLLKTLTGINIPIDQLSPYVRSVQTQQNIHGWEVNYPAVFDIDGVIRPRKIIATQQTDNLSSGSTSTNASLLLLIKQWL